MAPRQAKRHTVLRPHRSLNRFKRLETELADLTENVEILTRAVHAIFKSQQSLMQAARFSQPEIPSETIAP